MDMFDGDHNDFIKPDAGDEKLVVGFYMGILKDEGATIEQGRAIFKDVEYVRIYTPGDNTNVIDQPATERQRQRFAKQYARFKQGVEETDQTGGTPLKEWPLLTRAQVAELHYINIRTVEQLAGVSDAAKLKMAGLTSLSRNAQTWLGKTASAAEAAKQAKLIEDLQNETESLKKAVRDLMNKNEKLAEKVGMVA